MKKEPEKCPVCGGRYHKRSEVDNPKMSVDVDSNSTVCVHKEFANVTLYKH